MIIYQRWSLVFVNKKEFGLQVDAFTVQETSRREYLDNITDARGGKTRHATKCLHQLYLVAPFSISISDNR